MSITRDFKLSLVAGRSVPLVINANQYDDGEIWRFTLLDENGQKYSPSTGSIIGLKSDGHIIANAGTVSSTGLVIIPETEQMTASPGKNIYELLIDDDTHGTANFIVFVEPRPGAGGTPSDSDLAVFQEAIDAAATIGDVVDLVDDVAVLEARMDEFTTLTDGSTTGDAELADIRVGADGTTYPNAGDAVRGQVSDLKNAIKTLDYSNLFEDGYRITSGSTIGSLRSGNYKSCIINVISGDKLIITGAGASSGRLWAFADADKSITRRAEASVNGSNLELTAETGETYFVFNGAYPSPSFPPKVELETDRAKTLDILRENDLLFNNEINDINEVLDVLTIRNNLRTDGLKNLQNVSIYKNGTESESNYGVDGAKYVLNLHEFEKLHVYFKYRHNSYAEYSGTDVYVPVASVGSNNALNVQELFRGVTYQNGIIYKNSFFYPANITAGNSEQLNPVNYRPLNGDLALMVFYDGTVTASSSVKATFSNGILTFSVNGTTVGTVTITGTDTIQSLADAISNVTDFSCIVNDSNGTVSDLLLPDSTEIEFVETASRDSATVYGTKYIGIPFKVDRMWHSCEFIVDKTNQYSVVAFDGLTKYISFATSRALTDYTLVIGGNYTSESDITVRDLEIDINTYNGCEVVNGKAYDAATSNKYQLISKHNPRLMIFEGHGIFVGSESEAQEAYEASGSSTSQEAMQVSTDRLNIVFETLRQRGYQPIRMEDLILWKKGLIDLPKRCYLCTFDDNRLVNFVDYDKRKPFVKNGVYATIDQISDALALTDTISANDTTYTVSDAIDMIKTGRWYICSHTKDHRNLDQYTTSELIELLKADVLSCNTHRMHSDVLIYPYGSVSAKVISAMMFSDFAIGISTAENKYVCRALTDYRLSRTEIGTRSTLENVLSPFI